MQKETKQVQQGHLYLHKETGKRILAMATGESVEAYELDVRRPDGVSEKLTVSVQQLEPLPMTYFGGRIP